MKTKNLQHHYRNFFSLNSRRLVFDKESLNLSEEAEKSFKKSYETLKDVDKAFDAAVVKINALNNDPKYKDPKYDFVVKHVIEQLKLNRFLLAKQVNEITKGTKDWLERSMRVEEARSDARAAWKNIPEGWRVMDGKASINWSNEKGKAMNENADKAWKEGERLYNSSPPNFDDAEKQFNIAKGWYARLAEIAPVGDAMAAAEKARLNLPKPTTEDPDIRPLVDDDYSYAKEGTRLYESAMRAYQRGDYKDALEEFKRAKYTFEANTMVVNGLSPGARLDFALKKAKSYAKIAWEKIPKTWLPKYTDLGDISIDINYDMFGDSSTMEKWENKEVQPHYKKIREYLNGLPADKAGQALQWRNIEREYEAIANIARKEEAKTKQRALTEEKESGKKAKDQDILKRYR